MQHSKGLKAGVAFGALLFACGLTGAIDSDAIAGPYTALATANDVHCTALTGMKVEAGAVEAAEPLAQGDVAVGGETAGAKATTALCRVRARLHPVPGSDISVEVWLPHTWNGKLFGLGGAGFDGGLNPGGAALIGKAVAQGYAGVATDVGHKAGAPLESWAHKQPEKVEDFGHRGNHLAAVVAKQLISAFYGDQPRHAYFLGCSNGGRDGLMEATRYPEDYDGVIAGAPAQRYIEVLTAMAWNSRAIHGPDGAPQLESKLGLLHDAVIKKCDALDGLRDGLLENPQRCRFDPRVLQCIGADQPTCLTAAEVAVARKIYSGPRLRNGTQIGKGPEFGSELTQDGWPGWIMPARAVDFPQDFWRWLVYDDPNWTFADFDLDRDYAAARARLVSIVDPDSANLSAFAARGGRLIMYQGWDDPGITPGATLSYFGRARRRLGPAMDDHVRLFMVPGMFHCANGPGATQFDMQPVLERWVEKHEAPERVVAEKPGAQPAFTRPLCAWPKIARYSGTGSTSDAGSFRCQAASTK